MEMMSTKLCVVCGSSSSFCVPKQTLHAALMKAQTLKSSKRILSQKFGDCCDDDVCAFKCDLINAELSCYDFSALHVCLVVQKLRRIFLLQAQTYLGNTF